MLSNYTIKTKLFIVALVAVFGVVVMATGFLYSATQQASALATKDHLDKVLMELSSINFDLLNARYTEKEFLLRPQAKYISSQAATQAKIRPTLQRVTAQLLDDNEQKSLVIINAGVSNYFAHWAQFIAEQQKFGFSKTEGLLGAAREGSSTFNRTFTDLTKNSPPQEIIKLRETIDVMRRAEMELLARQDSKYIQEVSDLSATFDVLLKSSMLPVDVKSQLAAANKTYLLKFVAMGNQTVFLAQESSQFKVFYKPAKTSLDELTKAIYTEVVDANAALDTVIGQTKMLTAILLVCVIVIVSGLVVVIGRSISAPLKEMTKAMQSLARGELNTEIPGQGQRDEIGEMAQATNVFKDSMVKNDQQAEKSKQSRMTREARAAKFETMTNAFGDQVATMLDSVSASASNMKVTAESMSSTAQKTVEQSHFVSSVSEQATANVQIVASSSEDLSNSIQSIAQQVAESSKIANSAVLEVKLTNDKILGLADAASKIGEVVAMITDIADQTNLLALNATIEAARAGDSGKGFAVVASEVKNLANQTAKATEEISAQISSVQGATQEAVTAITSIGGIINSINDISSDIATAVEEQGTATHNIARNVEQVALGTNEVSSNIFEVTQAAEQTGLSSRDVLIAASEMSEKSFLLKAQVDTFLKEIQDV
ncbi:MAG: HAMP domain-containing protein [Magnetovibrio sp.]|nr:HAMP domain-containing protein [Magnetovibrio sp.]